MNKEQIRHIEWKLEEISKYMDKVENRLDKAEAEGNAKKARTMYHKLESLCSKIEGIEYVLNVMNYRISWELTDAHDVPHIVEFKEM